MLKGKMCRIGMAGLVMVMLSMGTAIARRRIADGHAMVDDIDWKDVVV